MSKSCIVCDASVKNHQNVCEKCDSKLRVPAECQKCKAPMSSEPLEGQISALSSRVRSCAKCGFNFFIPTGLAEAIYGASRGSLPKTSLTCLDLEWLFFAAFNYQCEAFGGSIPSIDCTDAGYKEYRKSYSVSRKNWLEIYWPPEDIDYGIKNEFMDIVDRYQSPQLWYGEYVEDDEQELVSIHFQSALELEPLFNEQVRAGLIYMLDEAKCDANPWLIAPIRAMLAQEDYFSN